MTNMQTILEAREARWQRRLELCQRGSLLTLTMNIPGTDKTLPKWLFFHDALIRAISEEMQSLNIIYSEHLISPAGPEAHFIFNTSAIELKAMAISFEERLPERRLADADVMDSAGLVISREALGFAPRQCFCCSSPAKECAALARHTLEEVMISAETLLKLSPF